MHERKDVTRIVVEQGALRGLGDALRRLGTQRPLIVTGPSRRFVPRALEALGDLPHRVFPGAKTHVPREAVDAALEALDLDGADTVVALGGGAAIGLGKALRLERPDLRFVAVPTTYAGSEMTTIWGQTSGGEKRTGRDARVLPDVVVYDPDLTESMPHAAGIQSLANALAHPVSALSVDDGSGRAQAARAIEAVWTAMLGLAREPDDRRSRREALEASSAAARVLDAGKLGEHHRVAHVLGGRFGLAHAPVHAILLPAFLASLEGTAPDAFDAVRAAMRVPNPAGALHDVLRRAGAPTSLAGAFELTWSEVEGALADADLGGVHPWVRDAWVGHWPSVDHRREDWGLPVPVVVAGPPLDEARRVVVAVHARGRNAGQVTREVRNLVGHDPEVAVVAPQAPKRHWSAARYTAPAAEHGRDLEDGLAAIDLALDRAVGAVGADRVALYGFSQGACFALEAIARTPRPLAAVVAMSGARPLPAGERPAFSGPLTRGDGSGVPVLLGVAEGDVWVRRDDVEATAVELADAGADVEELNGPEGPHALTMRQRLRAGVLLRGRAPDTMRGFDGPHECEALEGALPRRQNSPHRAPYGLYAEQVNTTGFAVPREGNVRTWTYRVRPTAQTRGYEPLEHETLVPDFVDAPPEPNLAGWAPLPIPGEPTDFVDGLATLGGAGSPQLRRGYAVHLYAANRSMDDRAFFDADGELLLVPQHGALTLVTDLGVLSVPPGKVAIVPRGMRFSVLLDEGEARGYVAEVFARRFVLPERGPIGANGLTDARHFEAPRAWFEDRLAPGFRITAKHGGALFDTQQDHSPWDVVAWHGNWVPYVYDLMDFAPAGLTRFDHVDPSVYTVVSAPLDETGADALDLVVFPPRWDPTEGTFRPPYFHRNVTTELNGIIRTEPSARSPFAAGMTFLTPSMTPHGVLARGVERHLALAPDAADRPSRSSDTSLWFQFESALPISLTHWARTAGVRITDWHQVWGEYRSHFDPTRR